MNVSQTFDIIIIFVSSSVIIVLLSIFMFLRGWLPPPNEWGKDEGTEKKARFRYLGEKDPIFISLGIETDSRIARTFTITLLLTWLLFIILIYISIRNTWITDIFRQSLGILWIPILVVFSIVFTILLFPLIRRLGFTIILSIRNAVESPFIIKHPRDVGLIGSDFRMKVGNWGKDTMDATRYILDIAVESEDEVLLEAFRNSKDQLCKLFRELWDEETGGFVQFVGSRPSVYSTYQIIAIIKRLNPINFLAERTDIDSILDYLDEDQISGTQRFIINALDVDTGGFFDAPYNLLSSHDINVGLHKPSLSNTHAAFNTLWNFSSEKPISNDVFRFVTKHCYSEEDGSFSNHPGDITSPSSLFFGLRLLENLDREGLRWIKSKKPKIISYLEKSWVEIDETFNGHKLRIGGFGVSHKDDVPVLLQTTFGCTIILDILQEKSFFTLSRLEVLKNLFYVNRSTIYGGYKFRPENVFPPNVFVTRNALTALKHLSREFHDFEEFYENEQIVAKQFAYHLTNPIMKTQGYVVPDLLLEARRDDIKSHFLEYIIDNFIGPLISPTFMRMAKVKSDPNLSR